VLIRREAEARCDKSGGCTGGIIQAGSVKIMVLSIEIPVHPTFGRLNEANQTSKKNVNAPHFLYQNLQKTMAFSFYMAFEAWRN